jgi:hypothetical protein
MLHAVHSHFSSCAPVLLMVVWLLPVLLAHLLAHWLT